MCACATLPEAETPLDPWRSVAVERDLGWAALERLVVAWDARTVIRDPDVGLLTFQVTADRLRSGDAGTVTFTCLLRSEGDAAETVLYVSAWDDGARADPGRDAAFWDGFQRSATEVGLGPRG